EARVVGEHQEAPHSNLLWNIEQIRPVEALRVGRRDLPNSAPFRRLTSGQGWSFDPEERVPTCALGSVELKRVAPRSCFEGHRYVAMMPCPRGLHLAVGANQTKVRGAGA